MLRVYVAILAILTMTACQRLTGQSPQSQQSATFELRDFQIQRTEDEFGRIAYRGRGTVVTRDSRLQKGPALLVLRQTWKQGDSPSGESTRVVAVVDGVGTLETAISGGSRAAGGKPTPDYEFKPVGYVLLNAAQLERK